MSAPTLAVWKFASCDGCQLTVLDCEDELLAIANALDIRMFLEAGPSELLEHYDVSLVEGSVTTAHDAQSSTPGPTGSRHWPPARRSLLT